MKFLIDAQLPGRMASWLGSAGCDAVHTLDLPDGNRTTDAQIVQIADQDKQVVISKDADFVNTHMLHGRPAKLLLVATGNISTRRIPWFPACLGAGTEMIPISSSQSPK